MEIKYTYEELIEAFNSANAAEQTDEYSIFVWARYAKILADALARTGALEDLDGQN